MIAGVSIVLGSASARLNEGAVDIVIADVRGCDEDAAEGLLREIEIAAQSRPLRVIVALHEAQIDLAAARLFGARVQLLCEPTLIDFATALAEAKVLPGRDVSDNSREAERLRRLNEEVARIAETLARLTRETRDDDTPTGSVRDVARGYGAPPMATVGLSSAVGPASPIAASVVRGAIRARRLRGTFFSGDLFADPAWDMLLDLFAASLEGARVSVSSLCIASAVPGTTALRWIATMTESGLFTRAADPLDGRRAYIALSGSAMAAMTSYFNAARAAGLMAG